MTYEGLHKWKTYLDSKQKGRPYEDDDDDEVDNEDDDGDAEIQIFHQNRECEPCLSSYSLTRLLPRFGTDQTSLKHKR